MYIYTHISYRHIYIYTYAIIYIYIYMYVCMYVSSSRRNTGDTEFLYTYRGAEETVAICQQCDLARTERQSERGRERERESARARDAGHVNVCVADYVT